MNVLFATQHGYPPEQWGGSESSTHDLCLAFAERGAEVSVLCASGRGPLGRPRRRRREGNPFPYPVVRAKDPRAEAGRVAREISADVAVLQAGRPLELEAQLRAVGVPSLVYLRDSGFDQLGGVPAERPGVRYVATSRDLGRRFADRFGFQPEVVPPLVRREAYQVESTRQSVLFVCPNPQKGVEVALALAARRPDIPFVFLESWRLWRRQRARLRRRLRSLGNVTLLVPRSDMRTVYAGARLVLVPSVCLEAWGRVVTEAQASGIPALASRLGGLPESVGRGGILVDPSAGLDEWERALTRLWDDEAEYETFSDRAREEAGRPELDPGRIATQLLATIADLRTGRR